MNILHKMMKYMAAPLVALPILVGAQASIFGVYSGEDISVLVATPNYENATTWRVEMEIREGEYEGEFVISPETDSQIIPTIQEVLEADFGIDASREELVAVLELRNTSSGNITCSQYPATQGPENLKWQEVCNLQLNPEDASEETSIVGIFIPDRTTDANPWTVEVAYESGETEVFSVDANISAFGLNEAVANRLEISPSQARALIDYQTNPEVLHDTGIDCTEPPASTGPEQLRWQEECQESKNTEDSEQDEQQTQKESLLQQILQTLRTFFGW